MHCRAFAERAAFAHQHGAALAQRAVDAFDHVGVALSPAPMLRGRHHGRVRRPGIGEAPGPPIRRRYAAGSARHSRRAVATPRPPSTQATTRRVSRSTASHSHTSQPHLTATPCGPCSPRTTTTRQTPTAGDGARARRAARSRRGLFFRQLRHRHPRHARQAHDRPLRNALGQQRFYIVRTGPRGPALWRAAGAGGCRPGSGPWGAQWCGYSCESPRCRTDRTS